MMDVSWKNKVWHGISKNMEMRSTETIHAHERICRCPVCKMRFTTEACSNQHTMFSIGWTNFGLLNDGKYGAKLLSR